MKQLEQQKLFDNWIRQYAAVLHHVANGFASGADRHDLMQELLLALWRAVPAFRESAKPSTYIFRVAHNAALTWKRAQKSYARRLDRYEAMPAAQATLLVEQDRAQRGRDDETLELIYAAIRELPPLDRSLIILHLDGASYADMAELHGMTESNVGVRLNRLKSKLAETLKKRVYELR